MNRYLLIGAAVAIIVLAICCPAASAGPQKEWATVSTPENYRHLLALNQPTVVLFLPAHCPSCQLIKDYWQQRGIPTGWLFLYWEERWCETTPGNKQPCGNYLSFLRDELRALGAPAWKLDTPIIIAQANGIKRYFKGYVACTGEPPASWAQPTPSFGQKLTLTEWIKDQK